jgi:hypothetical protein
MKTIWQAFARSLATSHGGELANGYDHAQPASEKRLRDAVRRAFAVDVEQAASGKSARRDSLIVQKRTELTLADSVYRIKCADEC